MNLSGADFMGRETPKIPVVKNLGEAFLTAARRLFPEDTRKSMQSAWGFDLKTAKNAAEGLAGAAVISKALKARQASEQDAWELWLDMGRALIGESLDDYEERKLLRIIEITENEKRKAVARLEERRERRARMEDRARALDDVGRRMAS
jgi:hypothetical protein